MRNSSGSFDGLPVCKSAATPSCFSHACSIWRTASRTSKPVEGFCVPGSRGAMHAYAEHRVEELGWLHRKASITPAGDCAATEWTLPRIVIRTSETVRLEGVSYTGHGVPCKDTVSRTGQSRPHKQNTQEGGSRTHARARSGTLTKVNASGLSGSERISLERRLGQIQTELAEDCRKKERARGEMLFAERCRHHDFLGWTKPRRPKWLEAPAVILPPENAEHEITDEEREAFCQELRRLRESLQRSTQSERHR